MCVGIIDKQGAPILLLSLIRTLTVGPRVSLSQPPIGYVRVADYNRRFEITSTPITTLEFYRLPIGAMDPVFAGITRVENSDERVMAQLRPPR